MKMYLILPVLYLSFCPEANAQKDSVRSAITKKPVATSLGATKDLNAFLNMSTATPAEFPPALKSKLQAPEYKGWETSPLYKNSTGDRFGFQLGEGESSRAYIFSHEGIPVRTIP